MILLAKSGNPNREVKELAQGHMTVSGRARTQTQDGSRDESLITPCCYPCHSCPLLCPGVPISLGSASTLRSLTWTSHP